LVIKLLQTASGQAEIDTLDSVFYASCVAPVLIESRILQETPSVSLMRFEHSPHTDLLDNAAQEEESYQVAIVERGWFRLGDRRQKWLLGPGSAFITQPGQISSYTHIPHREPDTCLCLNFKLQAGDPEELPRLFGGARRVIQPTNRFAFLYWRLRQVEIRSETLQLETLACEMLQTALSVELHGPHLYRTSQLAWYAQRVSAAREILERHYAEEHSLKQLASRVGMSHFLFARIFAELVGTTPHQFLLKIRFERARWMLEQGASVTTACYSVGFRNLSHFIRGFRERFGHTPSSAKKMKLTKSAHIAVLNSVV